MTGKINMKKKWFRLALAAALALPFWLAAEDAESRPFEVVQKKVDAILEILREKEAASEVKKRQIEAVLDGFFDFKQFSLRSLGRNWRNLDNTQQDEFVGLFKELLRKTYLDRVGEYAGQTVTYEKETALGKGRAEVQTLVAGGPKEIQVHYRLYRNEGKWLVYDVVIEHVSLVSNYRSQFKGLLNTGSPEKMLECLRQKVEKNRCAQEDKSGKQE